MAARNPCCHFFCLYAKEIDSKIAFGNPLNVFADDIKL